MPKNIISDRLKYYHSKKTVKFYMLNAFALSCCTSDLNYPFIMNAQFLFMTFYVA